MLLRQLERSQAKKLIEAAEHWVGGGIEDKTQDDAAVLGVALPEQEPEGFFEVWPENWPAIEMFVRCQTQWRTTMSGALGLDYGAVAWLFRLYEVKDERALLEDLQIMEGAALAKLNERSS